MKIMYVTSECAPFIKTGGLGDVAGSLPQALAAKGHDVRVFCPLYSAIDQSMREKFYYIKNAYVRLGWRNQYCGIFRYEADGVTYYFIDNEYYFARGQIYGEYDDAERFAYYSKAVLEVLPDLEWKPDVINCNDWQTALVPVYYNLMFASRPFYENIKTVFTIHNIQYQGRYGREILEYVLGIDDAHFRSGFMAMDGDVNLMKAESPGPQVDKLVPKVQSTAKILYGIYFLLTVLEFMFLIAGRMPVFEALLTSFGTAGTGGFGFRNDSFASMSPYIQWVVTIFMILFGVNFNAYFLLLMRRFRRAAASEEVRAYFVIIGVAVVIITANIYSMYNGLGEALRHAAFQVGSIITTTGFSSCDFDLWPTLSKEILVMLMFVGACAGSTGGGIKVSRLLLMGKTVGKELKQALHPQVVAPVRMDGKVVNHETIRATNVFVAAYIFIFAASFFLISLDGFDMVTNFTAIAATLNNIGPGLAQVGPMMNFGSYSNPAKLVMIFDMLAGRLEIFPMLVFFMPDTWRRF